MAERNVPFRIVAKDKASEVLGQVSVAVIDARGDRTEIIGEVMEFDLPEGVEWPPRLPDDGRMHHMEIVDGEAHCLPDCDCRNEEG